MRLKLPPSAPARLEVRQVCEAVESACAQLAEEGSGGGGRPTMMLQMMGARGGAMPMDQIRWEIRAAFETLTAPGVRLDAAALESTPRMSMHLESRRSSLTHSSRQLNRP